eukprot:1175567-Prorocentrum_minimum.AAC.2
MGMITLGRAESRKVFSTQLLRLLPVNILVITDARVALFRVLFANLLFSSSSSSCTFSFQDMPPKAL